MNVKRSLDPCICCDHREIEVWERVNLQKCTNCGYTKQIIIEKFDYNQKYFEKGYKNAPLTEMAWLRVGLIFNYIGLTNKPLLDFGYGFGDFIKAAGFAGYKTYGYDVSDVEVEFDTIENLDDYPSGRWGVVTMFDSFEHIHDLSIVFDIKTDYFTITVPNFTNRLDEDNIRAWRHYKPNEHLHYFTSRALKSLFSRHGYDLVDVIDIEDLIRKSAQKESNTLTYIFKHRVEKE